MRIGHRIAFGWAIYICLPFNGPNSQEQDWEVCIMRIYGINQIVDTEEHIFHIQKTKQGALIQWGCGKDACFVSALLYLLYIYRKWLLHKYTTQSPRECFMSSPPSHPPLPSIFKSLIAHKLTLEDTLHNNGRWLRSLNHISHIPGKSLIIIQTHNTQINRINNIPSTSTT